MNIWTSINSPTQPTQAQNVYVKVQYAPSSPANLYIIHGFYENGVFYDLQTGDPVEGPIVAWTPATPIGK